MLSYRKSDLFLTDAKYIMHGCNSHGVMGSGVAAGVRARFPEAYLTYHNFCENAKRNGMDILGRVVPWTDPTTGNLVILNAITQRDCGSDGKRYVSYDAVATAMRRTFLLLKANNDLGATVALPKIGAGLGGGSWEVIEAIIKDELAKHINVEVYTV